MWFQMITPFLHSQVQFPSAVTARQRAVLHDIAARHGLSHGSIGEGDERHIVLSSIEEGPLKKVLFHGVGLFPF